MRLDVSFFSELGSFQHFPSLTLQRDAQPFGEEIPVLLDIGTCQKCEKKNWGSLAVAFGV